MAAPPELKIFNGDGAYVAACKYADHAAVLVAFLGAGSSIRVGHAQRDIVWREGWEEFSAVGNGDRVARMIAERREQRRAARQ